MTDKTSIESFIAQRGITRLTHFTNSKNLPSIFSRGEISSTDRLRADGVSYAETDASRIDGRTGHVCCNIEYPNMYYFGQAHTRSHLVNYSDWVVFLIRPQLMSKEGTVFSPGNAAKNSGRDGKVGLGGLAAQYADSVYHRRRAFRHFPASPTDVQAEVQIPDGVPLSEVTAIVVADEQALKREIVRLRQIGRSPDQFAWYIGPDLFRVGGIVRAVQQSAPIKLTGPLGGPLSQGEIA